MKHEKKIIIVIICIILIGMSCFWLSNEKYADDNAKSYLNNSTNVTVSEINNGLYFDGPGTENALIFYPGANIEYISYSPLLNKLAEEGIDCFVVKMPLDYAFLNINAADDIIDKDYNYSHWYISGHSLGGAMASNYVQKHSDKVDGLILLASYSTSDISNIKIVSIYGSNDNILNLKTYNENKKYLGENLTEYVIEGGNHDQFGSYGNYDINATISAEQQLNETVKVIKIFINS